jgi:hypothetical protein
MNRLPIEYVAIIWGVFAFLAALAILFAGGNFILIGVLAVAAVLGTAAVAEGGGEKEAAEKSKRSASSNDTNALLELLDEDDLRELRGRVKQRLLDRIDEGGDGELSSLDALLAEQQLQKRR